MSSEALMPITAILIPAADCVLLAASACNWAGYHTFNILVFKCTHYTTCITLNVSQTGCTVESQLGFEPGSLVWRAGSLPIKPSEPAKFSLNRAKFSQKLNEIFPTIERCSLKNW